MISTKKLLNKILNAIKVDYVVDIGSNDDNWRWEKWNSGKVVAYKIQRNMSAAITTPSEGEYRTSGSWTTETPIPLTDITYGDVKLLNGTVGIRPRVVSLDTTNGLTYYPWSHVSGTKTNINIIIMLVGRWK